MNSHIIVNIQAILKSGDLETICKMMALMLLGFPFQNQVQNTPEESCEATEEDFDFPTFSRGKDYIPRVRTVLDVDPETGWPVPVKVEEDGAFVDQPYFTKSGDTPVLKDQVTIAEEERSAAGFMPEETKTLPLKEGHFYSQARIHPKQQLRMFHRVAIAIHMHSHQPEELKKIKQAFWNLFYKNKRNGYYIVNSKQATALKNTFRKYAV